MKQDQTKSSKIKREGLFELAKSDPEDFYGEYV